MSLDDEGREEDERDGEDEGEREKRQVKTRTLGIGDESRDRSIFIHPQSKAIAAKGRSITPYYLKRFPSSENKIYSLTPHVLKYY